MANSIVCAQWDHVFTWRYLSLSHTCAGWDVYLRHSPETQALWAWEQNSHQYANSSLCRCFHSQTWDVSASKHRLCHRTRKPNQQRRYTSKRQWVYQYYPLSAWSGPWMGCMTSWTNIKWLFKTDKTINTRALNLTPQLPHEIEFQTQLSMDNSTPVGSPIPTLSWLVLWLAAPLWFH